MFKLLLLVPVLVLIGIVGWMVADRVLAVTVGVPGTVKAKKYTKPKIESSVRYSAALKTSVPNTNYYPEEYAIWIRYLLPNTLESKQVEMQITKEAFDRLNVDDSVMVRLKIGGLSGKVWFKGIV